MNRILGIRSHKARCENCRMQGHLNLDKLKIKNITLSGMQEECFLKYTVFCYIYMYVYKNYHVDTNRALEMCEFSCCEGSFLGFMKSVQ